MMPDKGSFSRGASTAPESPEIMMLELEAKGTEALREIVMVLRAPGSGWLCPRDLISKTGAAPSRHG
jgi:hypothetical protein